MRKYSDCIGEGIYQRVETRKPSYLLRIGIDVSINNVQVPPPLCTFPGRDLFDYLGAARADRIEHHASERHGSRQEPREMLYAGQG